ncbi:MAG: DUF4276 family protein [Gammaproteobacteria bacterium]|nr:DUF4276 family protein [Gammaproteobacteria bacterium]
MTEKFGSGAAMRFIPYIQMHEFEGLLFSSPSILSTSLDTPKIEKQLQQVLSEFPTPEWINDGVNSSPSKRITKLFPAFDKPIHPVLAALEIGLSSIRLSCALFDRWVSHLEDVNLRVRK